MSTCALCKRFQASTHVSRKCGAEYCAECEGSDDIELCTECIGEPEDSRASAAEIAELEQRENIREYADWDF